MLRIDRGTTYRDSGLFAFGNLSTELGLAALGVGLAAVWELAPAIVPFLLAPLVVAYRALRLPSMELAARLDPKTDLFNARYFTTALEAEIERARRFERPLSILLADLDLLRTVNNTYGHLAGDAVLRGVAAVRPVAAAPLRHSLPVRRRGVRGRAARGRARGRAGDRGADSAGSRRDAVQEPHRRRRDPGQRSRSALRPIRSSRRRTTSSTRPISRCTVRRRSGGTASRGRSSSRRRSRTRPSRLRPRARSRQTHAAGSPGSTWPRSRVLVVALAVSLGFVLGAGHARACGRVRRRQRVASCPRVRRARAAGRLSG